MPEPQKTSTTKLWLKQLTTGTFRSFNEKVDRIAFLRNNKKALGLVLAGWCLTLFVCFFFLESFGARQKEAFFLRHAVAAEALANQSAPKLLEDDLLGLNREVADFSKTYKVIFATVLNHERKVVAHTDAERFNQPYQDLEAAEQMQVLNEVVVQSGLMADGLETISFTQNILISNQGEVKISDFGISKATTEPSLTQAGVIKGKLAYLAPEQALGKEVDHQADIYALGLVFYEILSGKRLYHFDSDIQAIRTIPEMVIPPVVSVRPEVPDALNRIVMQCLEKDKTRRYADAMSLHNDLRKLRARLQMSYGESDLSNLIRTLLKNA